MSINHKLFSSKILLFGEYTVTLGSNGLAMPFHGYNGYWSFNGLKNKNASGLIKMYEHVCQSSFLSSIYDCERFYKDIEAQLVFESTIPLGYGLGSSGALVAAFYDEYILSKTNDVLAIKSILAETEAAFHGTSSGLDPLVSLLNQAVFIESGEIRLTDLNLQNAGFYLVDTHLSRQTSSLVSEFKRQVQVNTAFKSTIDKLAAYNDSAITYCLENNFNAMKASLYDISSLQFDFFHSMIPNNYKQLWKEGLTSGEFLVKLCGAGGGGMMLVWTDNKLLFEEKNNMTLLKVE